MLSDNMKVGATGQFSVLLLVFSAYVVSCAFDGNETDRSTLLAFKQAINHDPEKALFSWNDSTHFCSWEGVSCNLKKPRRVTSLDLSGRGLAGFISPGLGNLTFLESLFLNTNALSGEIPPSLGQLHHLRSLYLTNNTLQGIIPSFANCSALKILDLSNNQVVGYVPEEATLPPGIRRLSLHDNNLTGTIPDSIGNIASLRELELSYNHIEGTIPDAIRKMPELKTLYVGGNNLSGRFPGALTNVSSLLVLGLAFNYFHGDLPLNLGTSLPKLQKLEIAGNLFGGHLPRSVCNASDLYVIDLDENYFSGLVPSSMGMLKELSLLNLQSNQFESFGNRDLEFVHSLSNCTELQVLTLYNNKLKGQIQYSLGNLSIQLQYLFLGRNELSGGFPLGVIDLPNLISLGLQNNHFTGIVPESVGTLTNLEGIYINNNRFTGFIPSSISNLSHLEDIYFSTNLFEGNLSEGLGNLQVLHELNFSDNNLHGSIPKEIFSIPTMVFCDLSFNNLDGPLPIEIGNAKQLGTLQLSSNKLSGDIPSALSSCESLEYIQLGHNSFSGSIPTSFGNIRTLEILNLSHNNLTGFIPASLGNLQILELMDLSFNHLRGEVPNEGIFKNTTALKIEGNQELCGGPLELHLPACPVMSLDSSKHKFSVIMKVMLPVGTLVSLIVVISVLLFQKRKREKESLSLPSFGRKFPMMSYSDLDRATKGFATSNLIGQGRYGSVYRGILLPEGNVVAIKVFSPETLGAEKSFAAECEALKNMRHRNLVPIFTACSSIDSKGNDFRALVYEFMPRGDLHNLLYSTQDIEGSSCLNYISLAQRLNIMVDVADALAYLHHNNEGTIVHCDLKPKNILLDDDMVAHVGDFGLARFKFDVISNLDSRSSLAIRGTIGYIAPECAEGDHHVSTAMDAYSFGVVLLEILIRRRPTDDMFMDGMSIAKFTEINFPDNVLQIVDPQLLQDMDIRNDTATAIRNRGFRSLQSAIYIGLCCTKSCPSDRISMQQVAAKLHGIRDAYLIGN